CPKCGEVMPAVVQDKISGTTVVASVGAFFTFPPLFWVPFVVKPLKDDVFKCIACEAEIGRV
ncbi:hypothetical protein GQ42DRAFT_115097, partial [Ramicandelaber brevisporus]